MKTSWTIVALTVLSTAMTAPVLAEEVGRGSMVRSDHHQKAGPAPSLAFKDHAGAVARTVVVPLDQTRPDRDGAGLGEASGAAPSNRQPHDYNWLAGGGG
jgi:hypothetical protein